MTREECCAVVSEKEMPITVYDMAVSYTHLTLPTTNEV